MKDKFTVFVGRLAFWVIDILITALIVLSWVAYFAPDLLGEGLVTTFFGLLVFTYAVPFVEIFLCHFFNFWHGFNDCADLIEAFKEARLAPITLLIRLYKHLILVFALNRDASFFKRKPKSLNKEDRNGHSD